jgi:hypothetical protein
LADTFPDLPFRMSSSRKLECSGYSCDLDYYKRVEVKAKKCNKHLATGYAKNAWS